MKNGTTVNDIIVAISQKIDIFFQSKYEIYINRTEQDFKPPCFFIRLAQLKEEPFFYNRRKKIAAFEITFFQKNDDANERNFVADEMRRLLRFIEIIDVPFRGTKYEATISNGVLVIMIRYAFFVTEEQGKNTFMEILTETQKNKE